MTCGYAQGVDDINPPKSTPALFPNPPVAEVAGANWTGTEWALRIAPRDLVAWDGHAAWWSSATG